MTRWGVVGVGTVIGFGLAVALPDVDWLTALAWVVAGFASGALAGGPALRGAWHGLLPTAVVSAAAVGLGTLYLLLYGSAAALAEWYAAFLPVLPRILLVLAAGAGAGALGAAAAAARPERAADGR